MTAKQQPEPGENEAKPSRPAHPYDNALKALMNDYADEIIPQLLPDAQVVQEQKREIERENLYADLVYLVQYKGKARILNLELQSGPDNDMPKRLLLYNVELYFAHKLPVLSVVLYLFETRVPTSPFQEDEDEDSLTFHYRVITLWTIDAQEIVEKHIISMYALLPGMRNANATLLIQALREMEKHYPRREFARHARRFRTILRRSTTVSKQDKQTVEVHMDYEYDSLIDEDPEVQERVARGKAEGLAEGLAEGQVEIAQELVTDFVEVRFPTLTQLARERVRRIKSTDALKLLAKQVAAASNEDTMRWLLNTLAA